MLIAFVFVAFMEFCVSFSFYAERQSWAWLCHISNEMTNIISISAELHYRTFSPNVCTFTACIRANENHTEFVSQKFKNPKRIMSVRLRLGEERESPVLCCVKNTNIRSPLQLSDSLRLTSFPQTESDEIKWLDCSLTTLRIYSHFRLTSLDW